MAKLQKRTDKTNANGTDKKPMDKIHVGFDVKTGCVGYDAIKTIVGELRTNNFAVNDRKLIIALAGETNKKFDDALTIFENGLNAVETMIAEKTPDEIVKILTGETGE